jgi:hypothetical protein
MRLRVVFLSMALGVMVAGNARAYDATGVIYDLSTLGTETASKPSDKGSNDRAGEGVLTPNGRRDWGHERGRGHGRDHERGRGHGRDHERGRGDWRDRDGGVDPGNERQTDPSPTPEPGTMLLLGGALAAGMRRFRKR